MKHLFLLLAFCCSTMLYGQTDEVRNNQLDDEAYVDENGELVQDTTARIPLINVIGDSYVKNNIDPIEVTWHYKMAQQLGYRYNNYGRNGSCLAWETENDGLHSFGPAILAYVWDMDPSADYVLIVGGHNDAFKISDSRYMIEDFRDSLELLIANIRQQCPKAQIGFVTPWYVNRVGFEEACKAIKQVCVRHNVPVLMNYSKYSPVRVRDAKFREEYFQAPDDYAHLNEKGHDLYLPTAMTWFKKYFIDRKEALR